MQLAADNPAAVYLVGNRDHLVGPITRQQLEEAASHDGSTPVSTVANRSGVHAHADHPIDVVLDRLAETSGVLPIVSRSDARRVEGIVTADSILTRQGHSSRHPIADVSHGPPVPGL
jgi:CBS domain-containing protein